ncbi:hypothetical protein HPB50_001514 [Hyalomma asiaticum]|uniref:Uncharacterized protein n=1 Tax=Hyalomma asiaticum TaxID=266040 RepID=A0ACB7TCU5_HYAAI|nr:hypothetical protein HPB50_001514 [Hyalomma asiaticum]
MSVHILALEVLFLPPNTTTKLQPMDQGVIKAGFSRRSSITEKETAAVDIGGAAGGAAGVMSLRQLWESTGNANLVPPGLDYMDFALVDEDLIATEELTIDELAASVPEKETIGADCALDPEGDDTSVPPPVTSGAAAAAIAAVDTLRMYLSSEPNICAQLDNVEAAVMKRARETQTGNA